MSPLAIDNVALALDVNFGQTALHSATDRQLDGADALLGVWAERVREAKEERRQDRIGQNGNDGYEVTE